MKGNHPDRAGLTFDRPFMRNGKSASRRLIVCHVTHVAWVAISLTATLLATHSAALHAAQPFVRAVAPVPPNESLRVFPDPVDGQNSDITLASDPPIRLRLPAKFIKKYYSYANGGVIDIVLTVPPAALNDFLHARGVTTDESTINGSTSVEIKFDPRQLTGQRLFEFAKITASDKPTGIDDAGYIVYGTTHNSFSIFSELHVNPGGADISFFSCGGWSPQGLTNCQVNEPFSRGVVAILQLKMTNAKALLSQVSAVERLLRVWKIP